MPSLLDQRPPSAEQNFDPRAIALMKQYRIWPPGRYAQGSRGDVHEQQIMQHINDILIRQDATNAQEAQRRDIHNENLAQRKDYHDALISDREANREARTTASKDANETRRATMLQLAAADPSLKPEERAVVKAEMLKAAGVNVAASVPGTTVKGEYGPGGAPNVPVAPESTTQTYTPPTKAFTSGGGGIPNRPSPNPRSFHASRYPASEGFTPADRTRIARNLDRVDAEDARINEVLYKRDIGGENYARVFGTETPTPGQAPAADIPQLFGGTPTIPDLSPVGYYDKAGNFLGPAYTPEGGKLARPKGATGLHGSAALPGITYDANGNIARVAPESRGAISGQIPVQSSRPQGVAGQYDRPELGRGINNNPPNENMLAEPTGYTPPTAAFLAPTSAPIAGRPQPNPTPGVPPAPDIFSVIKSAPIVTPTPGPQHPPPLVNPQAQNDRGTLLNDIEGTFYGGGQVPQPTPKPTPKPPHYVRQPDGSLVLVA